MVSVESCSVTAVSLNTGRSVALVLTADGYWSPSKTARVSRRNLNELSASLNTRLMVKFTLISV